LQWRWWKRTRSKGPTFPINEALKAHYRRRVKGSLFEELDTNDLIRKERLTVFNRKASRELNEKKEKSDLFCRLVTDSELKTMEIFKGVGWKTLQCFWGNLERMTKREQRLLLRWILSRGIGTFAKCPKCNHEGTKMHLQRCILGDDYDIDGDIRRAIMAKSRHMWPLILKDIEAILCYGSITISEDEDLRVYL
jgi:hypothetical protein